VATCGRRHPRSAALVRVLRGAARSRSTGRRALLRGAVPHGGDARTCRAVSSVSSLMLKSGSLREHGGMDDAEDHADSEDSEGDEELNEGMKEFLLMAGQALKRHDDLAQDRGRFIDAMIEIEGVLDELIADCLGLRKANNQAFMVAIARPLGLRAKVNAFAYLIQLPELAATPDDRDGLLDRLHKAVNFRNACAHVSAYAIGSGPVTADSDMHFIDVNQSGKPKITLVNAATLADGEQGPAGGTHSLSRDAATLATPC
jgi:hypothetical protein